VNSQADDLRLTADNLQRWQGHDHYPASGRLRRAADTIDAQAKTVASLQRELDYLRILAEAADA